MDGAKAKPSSGLTIIDRFEAFREFPDFMGFRPFCPVGKLARDDSIKRPPKGAVMDRIQLCTFIQILLIASNDSGKSDLNTGRRIDGPLNPNNASQI